MDGARKYGDRIKSFLFWGKNITSDSTFGASFLPYRLDDGWYSELIRLYKVPSQDEEVPVTSSIINSFSTLEELLPQRSSLVDHADPKAVTWMANLAAIYYYRGQCKTAEEIALKVVKFQTDYFGELHSDTVVALSNLVMIYVFQKCPDKVLPLLRTLSRLATSYTSPGQKTIFEEPRVEVLEQSRSALREAQQRQGLSSPWAEGLASGYGGNSFESLLETLEKLEVHQREHPNAPLILQAPDREKSKGYTCGLCSKGFPNRQKSTIHIFSYHWGLNNWLCILWCCLLSFLYFSFLILTYM